MEDEAGEDIVTCPYDMAHRVLRKRLQLHLIKCRLNYPNVELRKCPMNQLHLVPDPEYQVHLATCPDRKIIVQYSYESCNENVQHPIRLQHDPIESEENWDNTDVENYKPELYARTSQVIRQPVGSQRSKRKVFKDEEEKRFQQFD
ncbi:gametocyte-specific factor 1 homolog [Rhagoletis pomonella]|uniref:gametocyte-specific factor 1 homolog n=1 Tax=Rhagoletis pomonella TaxID=28610 RepID=UPI00178330E1|nr:gametocyte-specific factor 1 homolog [Rhagoletis pomonella]